LQQRPGCQRFAASGRPGQYKGFVSKLHYSAVEEIEICPKFLQLDSQIFLKQIEKFAVIRSPERFLPLSLDEKGGGTFLSANYVLQLRHFLAIRQETVIVSEEIESINVFALNLYGAAKQRKTKSAVQNSTICWGRLR
jgi:hypothetical protein